MNIRTYKILSAIFGILTLLCLFSIFRFGSQNIRKSTVASDKVVEKVKDAAEALGKPDIAAAPSLSTDVRKSAHIIEYFALGVCSSLFAASFFVISRKKLVFLPSTLCFSAAIADEYIQSRIERTGSVVDVAIDACGAAAGIVIVAAVIGAIHIFFVKPKI